MYFIEFDFWTDDFFLSFDNEADKFATAGDCKSEFSSVSSNDTVETLLSFGIE